MHVLAFRFKISVPCNLLCVLTLFQNAFSQRCVFFVSFMYLFFFFFQLWTGTKNVIYICKLVSSNIHRNTHTISLDPFAETFLAGVIMYSHRCFSFFISI